MKNLKSLKLGICAIGIFPVSALISTCFGAPILLVSFTLVALAVIFVGI